MSGSNPSGQQQSHPPSGQVVELVLAWAFVGIPLIWGVIKTIENALKLFR
jgi:hypothetical protein